MSEDNKERPFSKLVLEIGPLIIFFLCYYKAPIPENIVNDIDAANLFKIIFATKIFVPAILIALFISWLQTKKIANRDQNLPSVKRLINFFVYSF